MTTSELMSTGLGFAFGALGGLLIAGIGGDALVPVFRVVNKHLGEPIPEEMVDSVTKTIIVVLVGTGCTFAARLSMPRFKV